MLTVNWIRKSNLRENTSKQASYRQASQSLLDEKKGYNFNEYFLFIILVFSNLTALHNRIKCYPSSDSFSKSHSRTDRLRTWNSTTWWWIWRMGRANFFCLWRTNENLRGGRKNISRGLTHSFDIKKSQSFEFFDIKF